MNKYIELVRPRHVFGSVLIFLFGTAFFYKVNGFVSNNLWLNVIAFAFTYSAVYVYNDLTDMKEDQRHHVSWKANRPLPKGLISKQFAEKVIIADIIIGLGLSLIINYRVLIINTGLLLINLFYTKYHLKNYPRVGNLLVASMQFTKILGGWVANTSDLNGLPISFLIIYASIYGLIMSSYKKNKFKSNNKRKNYMLLLGLITILSMIHSLIYYPITQLIFLKIIIIGILLLIISTRVIKDLESNFLQGIYTIMALNLCIILSIIT